MGTKKSNVGKSHIIKSTELTLFDNANELTLLTKDSPVDEIKIYFNKVYELKESGDKFPVKLDEVWQLVYPRKDHALRELKEIFIKNVDYQPLLKNGEQKMGSGGHNKADYKISVSCMEWFIARKVRPVFDVYRKVFERFVEETKNPDLLADRYISTYKKRGKTDNWIKSRLDGKLSRNHFTATLAKHKVTGEGYSKCTNAIYEPLFGGNTDTIREKYSIEKGKSIRDNLSMVQLAAIQFSETLASDDIEKGNRIGNVQCELASHRASNAVRKALLEHKKVLTA